MGGIHPTRIVLGGALLLLASVTLSPPCATPTGDEEGSLRLDQIRTLYEAGRYASAETNARTLLAHTEDRTGEDSLEAATAIDLLVEILIWEMKSAEPETLPLAERALRIRENRLEAEHSDVASSAYRLGMVWFDLADFERSLALIERSLTLRRGALGDTHPDVAESLDSLGLINLVLGDAERARQLLDESLEIRRFALGKEHPLVADALMSRGNLGFYTSDYAAAERDFQAALEIRTKSLRPHHPKVAGALHNLAVARQVQGDLDGARQYFERALVIRNASLDSDAPRLATTHLAVATLDRDAGDYTAARQQYQRALDSYERWLGQEHEKYAVALQKLAELNQLAGDLEVARGQCARALEIRRKVLGEDHPDVAKSLSALAYIILEQRDASAAKSRFEEALRIRQAVMPKDSMMIASIRAGLGLSLFELGETTRASELLEDSLQTMEQVFGRESPQLIESITALAVVRLSSGETDEAVNLLREGRTLVERYYGPDHPDVAMILGGEAIGLAGLGRTTEAMETALRAAWIARTHVGSTTGALSERQALAYAANSKMGIDTALTVLTSLPRPSAETVSDAWDALLRVRGLVLDEMTARHRYVEDSADSRVRSLAEELRSIGQQLANVVVRGPGDGDPEQHAKTVATLRARREALELDLAVASRRFREELARGRIGIAEIAASLPARSALVAYAQFDRYDPARPSESAVPAMIALVMPAGGESTEVIDLGNASEVDRAIARWRTEVSTGFFRHPDKPEEAERSYRRVGTTLRQAIWDPVKQHLGDAEQVFIVPDGGLNLVSFAALPAGSTEYLVESGPLLHVLTSEKDLATEPDADREGVSLLAVGGPDFDATPAGSPAAAGNAGVYRGRRAACIDIRTASFGALPDAVREVEEVAALWPQATLLPDQSSSSPQSTAQGIVDPLVLTGADATESRFKQEIAGRRVVHVASHGFFLGDQCVASMGNLRGIGGLTTHGGPKKPPGDGDPPQLLSGLVFAGANRRAETTSEEEDGILTAEEIAALDLRGVQWVVLSACETGLGEVQVGEGVFGLRRAFRVAGASTLIMSLWAVDDQATRAWMRTLYEARHAGRMSTAESVQHAMLTTLHQGRESGRGGHPFFWAAFVAAGDWR